MPQRLQRTRATALLRRRSATVGASWIAVALTVSWPAVATGADQTAATASAAGDATQGPGVAAATGADLTPSPSDAGASAVSSRIIQYRGPMPLLDENYWGGEAEIEFELERAREAADAAPDRESRLDVLVDCGPIAMETHPRTPATWLDADAEAARLGARLPTFEEWYGAYDGESAASLVGLAGHYEWVIPWVYGPQIHARLHELYRGKPVACYYNELSPLNDYPYRLVVAK